MFHLGHGTGLKDSCKTYIYISKDPIWLESKTGMDPSPRSPNNEFIECGKES